MNFINFNLFKKVSYGAVSKKCQKMVITVKKVKRKFQLKFQHRPRAQFYLILFILGCSQISSQHEDDHLLIVTSIFPIYEMTVNLTQDSAEVIYMIPPGANPHIYEPSPDEVIIISQADIFIGIDPHFDGWVEKFLSSPAKVYYLTEGNLNLKAAHNPHIWLSLKNAETIVLNIAEILSETDSIHKSFYNNNLQIYVNKIESLNYQAEQMFSNLNKNKFIQWHPAWDYMASDYGLEIVATIESGHGDQPTIRQMEELIEKALENQVNVVVIGFNLDNSVAQTLADEINGKLVRLDVMGTPDQVQRSTYLKTMEYNFETLYDALNPKD